RVELDELEVGDGRTGAEGHRHAFADRAGRIRGPLPERRVAAGGDDGPVRLERATRRPDADAPRVLDEQPDDLLALADADPRVREHALREHACDAGARRSAVRVQDAPPRMPALEPEAVVERHAELDEIGDASGRLVREHANRASPAEPPPGA